MDQGLLWLINKDSCCVGLLSHVTRSCFGLGELGNTEDHIICLSATINKCDMMRGEHTEHVLLVRETHEQRSPLSFICVDFGPAGPSRPNATMLLETVRLARPNAAVLPCGLCQCERQNKLCKKQGAGIDQDSVSSHIGHRNESQRGTLNSSQIENQVYPLKGPKQYVRQFSDRSCSLFSRRPIAILQTISTQKQVYPLEDPQIEASYFSQRPKSIF